jgi:hypothetical protein
MIEAERRSNGSRFDAVKSATVKSTDGRNSRRHDRIDSKEEVSNRNRGSITVIAIE